MKIVFVSRLYLPHLGGVEIHLKEISAILVRMGHEVTIITSQHDKKLNLEADYNGVRVFRIPFESSEHKQKTWQEIKKLSQIFLNADIVHVHDVFWWILPIFLKIRKKTYITFHGWETKFPIPVNSKIHRFLASIMSRGTIHVGSFIQQFYWDKPNAVVYGGINPKRFTKANMPVENEKFEKLHFVFVGRLDKDTDVSMYLDFLTELKSKKVAFEITWVGDGELANRCKLFGNVTGFVKNISQYIVTADLVFASSYLSILEALCLEKIVLAFYSNLLKREYLETFPGAKFMLISGTISGMISKLEHLLTSRKLQRQMERDAKQFALQLTWDKVVAQYLNLWGK